MVGFIDFLSILALSFGISVALFGLLLPKDWVRNLYAEKRRDRDIHSDFKARIGGLVIIPLFILGVMILMAVGWIPNDAKYWGMLVGALMVLGYGYWDEKKDLSWHIQLGVQVAIALVVVASGIGIDAIMIPFGELVSLDIWNIGVGPVMVSLPADIISILWIVGLMNVVNWLDGIDGLAGGVGVIGFGVLFVLAMTPFVGQVHIAILCALLAGLYLGFLRFNWYPSKIFLGTYGSMFLGYIMGILAIVSGGKMATASLVFAFPILDAVSVISQRLAAGQSIFQADNRHFHHKLLQLGLTQRQAVGVMYGLSLIFGMSALVLQTRGKAIVFALGAITLVGLSLGITWIVGNREAKSD